MANHNLATGVLVCVDGALHGRLRILVVVEEMGGCRTQCLTPSCTQKEPFFRLIETLCLRECTNRFCHYHQGPTGPLFFSSAPGGFISLRTYAWEGYGG
jgi:hypothetical protein